MRKKNSPSIFKRLILKVKSKFIDFSLKFSLFLNSPKFTARVFKLASKRINYSGKYTVVCTRRSVFIDDLKAMAELSGRINYVIIGRIYFKMILHHFITREEKELLTEENYHLGKYGQAGIKKYRNYLKAMLPVYKQLIGFDAMMSANFGYIEQQEIARVCQENNIPFIILHKEGLTVNVYEGSEEMYKDFKFIGDKMLLYNEKVIKALIGKNSVPGITADKVAVVGVPRLDYYFKEKNRYPSKQLVLFSFYPKFRFRHLAKTEGEIEAADEAGKIFHKWVMNFAKNHPDYQVIIKTKVADFYTEYVNSVLRENFTESLDNLTITDTAEPFKLIQDAVAVLGFSSMTLIEAAIADKMIISPDFSQIFAGRSWDYFDHHPDLINYVKTETELNTLILNQAAGFRYNQRMREDFLKDFIYLPDGRASLRTEDEIIKVIKT